MRRPLRLTLLGCAALPAIGLAGAALASTGVWPFALAGHWAPHLAILSLPFWCLVGRRPVPGLTMCAIAMAALWPWLLAAHAGQAPKPGSASVRVQTANLFYLSRAHPRAIASIDADLVALVETLPEDRELLRHDPRWPHQCWVTPRNFGGMALLSRWPMRTHEELYEGAPVIIAEVAMPWGATRVFAVHTWSPTMPSHLARNRRQFAELAAAVASAPGPCLVLGDLNAGPSDPAFRSLRAVGLLPAAGGEAATWPSWFGSCGIGIDHILARGLGVDGAEAVALAGSDHRSLRTRVGPP